MTSPGHAARIATLGLLLIVLHPAHPRSQTPSLDETFAEVRELRAQGDFDRAITLLSDLIREHSHSEEVLRKAYNDLVFTHLSKRNATSDPAEQDSLYADLITSAEDALTRFPDIEARTQEYPPEINLIYQTRRALMFGSVEVTANTDSSRVFLGPKSGAGEDTYHGITPLKLRYIPVGDYQMTVTRSGYKDRVVPLTVGPSAVVQREVTLSKERTKKWWLTRVVTPVVVGAAAVVAVVVGSEDDTPADTTQPLAGPPPPPAGR